MKKIILLVTLLVITLFVWAQDSSKQREAGLLFQGFDSFGLTYRNGTAAALWRYDLLATNFRSNTVNGLSSEDKNLNLGLDVRLGREFRKPIGEKINFRYGIDLSAGFDVSKTDTNDQSTSNVDRDRKMTSWNAGFNAVIGLNYEISNQILLGAEFLPGLSYFQFKDEQTIVSTGEVTNKFESQGLNFGLSSSNILLSLVVKF